MFLPSTAHDFAHAYFEARRSRVPRESMGDVERGGYYLVMSATRSSDGEMNPRDALRRALGAGEQGAAMSLFEGLLSKPHDALLYGPNPSRATAAGEIYI